MNRQTLADVLQDTNQTGSYTLATAVSYTHLTLPTKA